MTEQQARDFLARFFNNLPSFCDQIIAMYKAADSGRATEIEKQTLMSLVRQREQVGDALSALYASPPLNAAPSRFPHINRFIGRARPLIRKRCYALGLGTIIKDFGELCRFRAINSETHKDWWQAQTKLFSQWLSIVRQHSRGCRRKR